MFRDVGYARISKDDTRRGRGVARQTEDIEQTSEATGGQLLGVFTENDLSASRYARKKRKEYPRIIDMARAGTIDRVIVYRLDRLLRIPRELEDLIDLCETRNLLVVNLNGSMDLTTAEGRKAARDRVADAAFESDLTSERTRDAFDQMARDGIPKGGKGRSRAFGYEPDGVTVREGEAALIRQAARDVLAGESLSGVARRWNDLGARTPRANTPWENRTVRAVLTGRRQAGLRIHREGRPDEATFPGAWEPIIDRDTHDALRRLLLGPDRQRRPPRRTPFTGLFVTPQGAPLRRDRDAHREVYRTWRPAPTVAYRSVTIGPAADVEAFVLEVLFAAVEDGSVARRVTQRRARRPAQPVDDPVELERQIVQAAADEAEGLIGRAEWLVKRERLRVRLEAAQAAATHDPVTAALDGVLDDLRARWWDGRLSDDRKGAILRAVFERIVIHPASRRGPGVDLDRVEPIWRA